MIGTWKWTESHKEPNYTNWHDGQPSGIDGQDCALIDIGNTPDWWGILCDSMEWYEVPVHALCQLTQELPQNLK